MITQLSIKNFKKFNELHIKDLERINLIVGSNNTGKTTTLESIMGFACGSDLASMLALSVWRRFPQVQNHNNMYISAEIMANAFHISNNIDTLDLSFSFSGTVDGVEKSFQHHLEPGQLISSLLSSGSNTIVDGTEIIHRQVPMPLPIAPGSSITVDVPSQYLGEWSVSSEEETLACKLSTPLQFSQIENRKSLLSAKFHDFNTYRFEQEISKVYAYLETNGTLEEFIRELNDSFPDIEVADIVNIPYPDGSNAPIKIKFVNGNRHPIYALGDGFRRWYELLGGMLTFPKSVHCIEEADATLHHQAQEGFATNLLKYARKYDNQIFITTHSKEYLKSFLSAIEKNSNNDLKNSIRVITLRDYDGIVKYRTLDGKESLQAIRQGMELRI